MLAAPPRKCLLAMNETFGARFSRTYFEGRLAGPDLGRVFVRSSSCLLNKRAGLFLWPPGGPNFRVGSVSINLHAKAHGRRKARGRLSLHQVLCASSLRNPLRENLCAMLEKNPHTHTHTPMSTKGLIETRGFLHIDDHECRVRMWKSCETR